VLSLSCNVRVWNENNYECGIINFQHAVINWISSTHYLLYFQQDLLLRSFSAFFLSHSFFLYVSLSNSTCGHFLQHPFNVLIKVLIIISVIFSDDKGSSF
jgi:hypothetical protein